MQIKRLSNLINAIYDGDPNLDINFISSLSNPKKNGIIYISKINQLNLNIIENIGCILTNSEISKSLKNCNLLISDNPRLSFALLTQIFKKANSFNYINEQKNISKNHIQIGENSSIGENFSYGLNVIIDDNVSIGNNVRLGHNVVLHNNTLIGDNVIIESGSIIGSEGFGNVQNLNKTWTHIEHLGSVVIHNNVQIGANCCIDRGTIDNTIIEKGVIIDNLVHIAHNVKIGENTAIAAKVGIAGSSTIGKRNMIGGMVGIVNHIRTVDDVIISATTTVNKDITEPGVYTGIFPISKHSKWKRIALWITKLDKIVKFLKIKKI